MTRSDLQQLARERVRDAKILLANRRWSAAYYLAGYAVECGLKACIVVRLRNTDDFPDRRFSEQCWTHNLTQLLGLTGLQPALDADAAVNADLWARWETVKEWNEATRYAHKTRSQALALYRAVTDKKHGVLTWLQSRW